MCQASLFIHVGVGIGADDISATKKPYNTAGVSPLNDGDVSNVQSHARRRRSQSEDRTEQAAV